MTPRPSPGRAAILLVVSLLVATLAAALLPAAPASASRIVRAATPTPSPTPGTPGDPRPVNPVSVVITEVTPSGLGPDGDLTVGARVRNTGSAAISLDMVRLGVTTTALEDRQALADWADPEREGPGLEAVGVERPAAQVPPGGTIGVVFTVPADELPRVRTGAGRQVHGIAVRVLGGTEDDPSVRTLGVARSYVVRVPQEEAPQEGAPKEGAQARLTVVVPITADGPTPDAGAASEQLRASWAADGRLSRVLASAQDPALSWLVDPALARAARTVARGEDATPATPSPSSPADPGAGASAPPSGADTAAPGPVAPGVPGTAAGDAELFGQRLQAGARARTRSTAVLPWADPDVTALARARLRRPAAALLRAAEDDAQTAGTVLLGRRPVALALPADGRADTATLDLLAAQRGREVLLDRSALPLPEPAADTGDGEDAGSTDGTEGADGDAPAGGVAGARVRFTQAGARLSAIAFDPVVSALLAQATTSPRPVPARQRLLAELALVSASTPAGGEVVAVLPRDWNPVNPASARSTLNLVKTLPWVAPTTLDELRERPQTPLPRLAAAYPASLRAAELPAAHVAAVGNDFQRLTTFSPVLPEPDTLVQPLRRKALSLVSLGWRGRDNQEIVLARTPLTTRVDDLYRSIEVFSGSTKNLLAKSANLPVTVKNHLQQDAVVWLKLRSSSGRLLTGERQEVALPARRSTVVQVPVQAVANGDVEIQVQLFSPRGALLSTSTSVEVRVLSDWENRGLIAGGVLLALLLLVGLVRGVRRGRRARIPADSVPDPDDVGRVPVPDPPLPGTDADAEADDPLGATEPADRTEPADTTEPGATADQVEAIGSAPVGAADDAPATQQLRTTVLAASGPPSATATMTLPPPAPVVPRPLDSVAAGPPVDQVVGQAVDRATDRTTDQATDRTPPTDAAGGPVDPPPGTPDAQGAGEPPARAGGSLLRSSALMAAGTLTSRVLGLVRAVVLVWAIGALGSGDAFAVANTLPNSLFILIGGGVLNAVLVPQIVRAAGDPDGGQEYVDRLLTLSVAFLAAATVVVTAAAPLLVRLYASEWSPDQLALATVFAVWCLPQVFFYGLYTVLGQVLNARGSFGPYMWAPVVNNVVSIAGMLVFVALFGRDDGRDPASWTPDLVAVFAGSATLGVVAQALVLVPVLRRSGFTWRPRWGVRGVGLQSAARASAWTFAALAVGQLAFLYTNIVINGSSQNAGRPAGRTVYDQAFLLFMLPHSLVTVSLVTAVFTSMSTAAAAGRVDAVRSDLSVALRTTGVATVLATAAFLVLGGDLVRVLYVGSDEDTTAGIARVATAMVLGLVPFSALYLFQRVFYAYEDARTPFLLQLLVVGVWSAGNLLSSWLLPGRLVVVGVAASMSVANLVGAAAALFPLHLRLSGVDGARVVTTHLRLLLAAAVAAGGGWVGGALGHTVAGEDRTGSAVALVLGAAVLVPVYLGALRVLKVRELDALMRPVTARLRRAA